MIVVKNYPDESVVYVTFPERVTDAELRSACAKVRSITLEYQGRPHVTCSDVRQMRAPFTPVQEAMLADAVGHQRRLGMKFCCHVVAPASLRGMQLERALQSAGAAEEGEAVVSSLEEAAQVLGRVRERLGLDRISMGSIATQMEQVHERLSKVPR